MSVTTAGPQARTGWRDAFEVQMEQARWQRSHIGERWMLNRWRLEVDGAPSAREMLKKLYAAEYPKVSTADPVYVSPEMCELVAAASEQFQPEALLRTDLLTDSGFVYFANGHPIEDRFDETVTLRAFSWMPIVAGAGGVSAKEAFIAEDEAKSKQAMERWRGQSGYNGDGVALTLYAETPDNWQDELHGVPPSLVPIHLTPWYFGMEFEGNEWDEIGQPTGAEWWWRIVQTTLRLMIQRIAVRHQQHPARAERRAAQRAGVVVRPTLVIQLRRERGQRKEEAGVPVEWSHRWIVSGHWRRQYFPTEDVHRQIWIGSYVKGPDEKPLVVKPRRAYTWDR